MRESSKFLAGLAIGVAAGAAITILLNTEMGKEFLADLKSAASKVGEDLKNAASNWQEELTATKKNGNESA